MSRRTVSTSSPAISVDSVAMMRRCDATRDAYGSGSTRASSIFDPTGPKMSEISGITPHLPSTAWMLALTAAR